MGLRNWGLRLRIWGLGCNWCRENSTSTNSGLTYILASTHMPTMFSAPVGTWVNQGTHASVGMTTSGWNHYNSFTSQPGTNYTLSCQARLVSGSCTMINLGLNYWTGSAYVGTSTTFTAAHNLNTTTYTTVSISFTAVTTSMNHVFGSIGGGVAHGQTQAGTVQLKKYFYLITGRPSG